MGYRTREAGCVTRLIPLYRLTKRQMAECEALRREAGRCWSSLVAVHQEQLTRMRIGQLPIDEGACQLMRLAVEWMKQVDARIERLEPEKRKTRMRTESEVRERLSRLESDLAHIREQRRRVADNPPTSDEDPQFLFAEKVATVSAIEELRWVLEKEELS